jgi:hypothetical protein
MGSKNKTVSFRVDEDMFESLREIAEERDLSLSAVFRDYVDTLVKYNGKVSVEPDNDSDVEEFPPTVEVPKSFVREHERLELEAEHLREQLEEHKRYIDALREKVEAKEGIDDVIHLDDLDGDEEEFHLDDEPYQLR